MQSILFPASLFLSALLLFVIQPMVAKVLLPFYGGTSAVWTVCMLFFQTILLLSYAYAWLLSRLKGGVHWRVIHAVLCLISVVLLPIMLVPKVNVGAPDLMILKSLFLQLGLPLLVIGASAPLLQYAYSQTQGKNASDPYFLYVISNMGSLLALLSYPWLIERFSGVIQQFQVWNGIYFLYLGLLWAVLFLVRYDSSTNEDIRMVPVPWRQQATWVFWGFMPCSLMLGVTAYITTDVAATPLFWVIPLALYLISFMITFAQKPIVTHAWVRRNVLWVAVFPILGFIIGDNQILALELILANLAAFIMFALFFHGELVRTRPHRAQLTLFYFCMALGGMFAGIINGLFAPRFLTQAYEYPFVFWLAIICIPLQSKPTRLNAWLIPILILGCFILNQSLGEENWFHIHHVFPLIALLLLMTATNNKSCFAAGAAILMISVIHPWFKPVTILTQQRNFYGVKQVFSKNGANVLLSQNTLHGFQILGQDQKINGTLAYYGSVLPVVQQLQNIYPSLHAMVLGLGTGILTCQFRDTDKVVMVEIDKQVINIAKDPHFFTYLRDCPAKPKLIEDDGRLAMTKEANAAYELLILDAFNADAVPVHLLTLEAFKLYKEKLTGDGVILANITNRHLRLLPVLTAAGRELDMIVLHRFQPPAYHLGQFPSEWVLLTTNESLTSYLLSKKGWRFVTNPETRLWTNDYSNLVPLLKWSFA